MSFFYLALYNKACLFVSKGEKEKSVDYLNKAFKLDPSLKEYAKTDPDLKGIL
ncbi:TPR end-of-group domain-containing protein [Persephonella sp.]